MDCMLETTPANNTLWLITAVSFCDAATGPCDLGITYGLHVENNFDIGKMIASPELAHVYDGVLKVIACWQPVVFHWHFRYLSMPKRVVCVL